MTQLQKLLPKHSSSCDLQIIFIHGLGGDIRNTWMNNPDDHTSLWPQWIADETGCCVWLVGYDASPSSWRGSPMELRSQGQSILDALTSEPLIKEKPMLLVGHSLGGLIIKAMFSAVDSLGLVDFRWFLKYLRGVAFVATPHSGSDLARMLMLVPGSRPTRLVRALISSSSDLIDLNTQFRNKCGDYQLAVRAYAETRNTPIFKITILGYTLPLWRSLVVSAASSDPGVLGGAAIPLGEDHIGIAKPKDRTAQIHRSLLEFIEKTKPNLRETANDSSQDPRISDSSMLLEPGEILVKSVVMAIAPANEDFSQEGIVCSVIIVTDEPSNFRSLLPRWRETLIKDPLIPREQEETIRKANLLGFLENFYTRSRVLEWLAVTHFHAYVYYADTRKPLPKNFNGHNKFILDPLTHRISKKDEKIVKYYCARNLEKDFSAAATVVASKHHRIAHIPKHITANESDLLALAEAVSWATREHLMAVADPEKSRVFEMLRTRIKFAENVATGEVHTRSKNPLP